MYEDHCVYEQSRGELNQRPDCMDEFTKKSLVSTARTTHVSYLAKCTNVMVHLLTNTSTSNYDFNRSRSYFTNIFVHVSTHVRFVNDSKNC